MGLIETAELCFLPGLLTRGSGHSMWLRIVLVDDVPCGGVISMTVCGSVGIV